MARFQDTIEVNAPVQACFSEWMRFNELPRIMPHVRRISPVGENRWHWQVDGPLGSSIEWDAEMDGIMESDARAFISWHSVSDSNIDNQGAVRFEAIDADHTRVTATIQYDAPAGKLGEAVARLVSNPEKMVEESLYTFKQQMEAQTSANAIV